LPPAETEVSADELARKRAEYRARWAEETDIPYGYCQCGCGQKTSIAEFNKAKPGWVKGEPRRFVQYHHLSIAPPPPREEDRGYETPCLIWQGPTETNGYGTSRRGGRLVRAHRVSYEEHVGPIPTGMYVCHRCDVRACVNPEHLFLGTHLDNMRDATEKGRMGSPKGEASSSAKLTTNDVLQIRAMYAAGSTSQRALARRFGVVQVTIKDIVKRRTWTHV